MSIRKLDPGTLPKNARRGRVERHLLALTGGGYRGLFSATVLRKLEHTSVERLANRFDMIAGTSIGGILAIGLACGVSADDLAELIREHGASIFNPRLFSLSGLTGCRYGAAGLETAIIKVLGKQTAKSSFVDIPVPLIVCAVDEMTSQPRLFRTAQAGGGGADKVSVLDVAMATSAAPTYFPPHTINGRKHVDGGLVANAPDALLLAEAMRAFGCSIEECHLLSIGTASSPRVGAATTAPGKLGWVARHSLVDLIMTAQEGLAMEQVDAMRPGTFLRIDQRPSTPIALDDVSESITQQLISLGEAAAEATIANRNADLRRFMAHTRE